MYRLTAQEGVLKVEKIRIELLVGGYSIPAIPTQSTENEGRVGRARMPYPPTFVAFNPYNLLLTHPPPTQTAKSNKPNRHSIPPQFHKYSKIYGFNSINIQRFKESNP